MRQTVTLTILLTVGAVSCATAAGGASAPAVAAAAQPGQDFRWSGQIARGKSIEIKNVNGDVDAVFASGNQVEVVARKHARRSDPASVSVAVVEHDGHVTICAVYPTPERSRGRRTNSSDDGPNECRPGDEGRMNVNNNDVQVDFTVRVPAGVGFVGRSVNGTIVATSLRSDVEAYTVNGRIGVSTSGVALAESVNGSIEATLGAAKWNEPLDYRTVNGSITLSLPSNVNAEVRAQTMNGGITSDFPITIQSSRRRGRRITGSIGSGGARAPPQHDQRSDPASEGQLSAGRCRLQARGCRSGRRERLRPSHEDRENEQRVRTVRSPAAVRSRIGLQWRSWSRC